MSIASDGFLQIIEQPLIRAGLPGPEGALLSGGHCINSARSSLAAYFDFLSGKKYFISLLLHSIVKNNLL